MMNAGDNATICIRQPRPADGRAVHELIAACPPLDRNSLYCNLLQCSHFADTCSLAERAGRIVGFVSGYRLPQQPHTLFVWQVAIDSSARGQGLGLRLLSSLLLRANCTDVTHLETTITASNEASWALFQSLARRLGAALVKSEMFNDEHHFAGQHESELLARIGPFNSSILHPAEQPRRTA